MEPAGSCSPAICMNISGELSTGRMLHSLPFCAPLLRSILSDFCLFFIPFCLNFLINLFYTFFTNNVVSLSTHSTSVNIYDPYSTLRWPPPPLSPSYHARMQDSRDGNSSHVTDGLLASLLNLNSLTFKAAWDRQFEFPAKAHVNALLSDPVDNPGGPPEVIQVDLSCIAKQTQSEYWRMQWTSSLLISTKSLPSMLTPRPHAIRSSTLSCIPI